jgi:hypothetical protein
VRAVLFLVEFRGDLIVALAVRLRDDVSTERQKIISMLGAGKVILTLVLQEDVISNTDPKMWVDENFEDMLGLGVAGLHRRLEADFSSIRDGDVVRAVEYVAGRAP